MRRSLTLLAVGVLAVSLVGCSSGGDGRACIEVPASIMERIADGANDLPIAPVAAAAVRSESFADVTVVAMSFEVGNETTEGVWAIGGSLDDPGITLSIDAVAASFTDWPNEMNGQKFTTTEDGAAEARDCLADL